MRSLFRRVSSAGLIWDEAVTEKLVWHVVKEFANKIGVSKLAPHDLRRSCARLCRAAGGELEQIRFLLGHISVQTTERYLGCTQRIASAMNDKIGIEPASQLGQALGSVTDDSPAESSSTQVVGASVLR
jgi:integrase